MKYYYINPFDTDECVNGPFKTFEEARLHGRRCCSEIDWECITIFEMTNMWTADQNKYGQKE